MTYRTRDGIKRDCPDFRSNPRATNICMYADTCDGFKKQGMYRDTFYLSNEDDNSCLGINDESRLNELEEICWGKPVKNAQESERKKELNALKQGE